MKPAEQTPTKTYTETEVSAQGESSQIEPHALQLTTEIAALDKQIAGLKSQRAAKHKDLRAATSKLVTAKLRGE